MSRHQPDALQASSGRHVKAVWSTNTATSNHSKERLTSVEIRAVVSAFLAQHACFCLLCDCSSTIECTIAQSPSASRTGCMNMLHTLLVLFLTRTADGPRKRTTICAIDYVHNTPPEVHWVHCHAPTLPVPGYQGTLEPERNLAAHNYMRCQAVCCLH